MKDSRRNIILLASCLFLSCAGKTMATSVLPDSPSSSIKEIRRYQKEIFLLQKDIAIQEGMEKEEKQREHTILHELESLDQELQGHQNKLHTFLKNSRNRKGKIAEQEAELAMLTNKRDEEVSHLQTRGTAFYTMGKIGFLNATFSSRTLPDLLTLHHAFDTLLQYDKKIILAYEQTIDLQQRTQRALKLEHVVLEELIDQIEKEKRQVANAKLKLLARLEEIRGQKKLRKQAIEELQKASEKLTAAIGQVKEEVIRKQGQFQKSKGQLPMPVREGFVATKYHQKATNAFGEQSRCNGIEIATPDRTEVLAISDGKISFAGYLQGYGNTVIIRHGIHHYTILSRLGEILVQKNAEVRQGEKIAFTGETATLFTKGLYFEIREKQQQQDPLEWLDPAQVRFKKS